MTCDHAIPAIGALRLRKYSEALGIQIQVAGPRTRVVMLAHADASLGIECDLESTGIELFGQGNQDGLGADIAAPNAFFKHCFDNDDGEQCMYGH